MKVSLGQRGGNGTGGAWSFRRRGLTMECLRQGTGNTLRVLFVDDEPGVLHGLRLALRHMRDVWRMSFAASGPEALGILADAPHDVVVSDMRMPGMDGDRLLAEVQRRFPDTLRIILSGYSDYAMIMRTVKSAHQFLNKPCSHEELIRTVNRAVRLREVLCNPRIRELLGAIGSLPSLPEVFAALREEMDRPEPSLQRIGNLVSRDMGMSASVLKLVNSSFFGLRRHIASPRQAMVMLGLETARGLLLLSELFRQFSPPPELRCSPALLWRHCTGVGLFGKAIAAAEGLSDAEQDDCFIAGLLHDVGKLVLLAHMPGDYGKALARVREEGVAVHAAEQDVFGASHAEVGAYLLALWGLPDIVVESVFRHHMPAGCTGGGLCVAAVHAANALHHELVALTPGRAPRPADAAGLATCGLDGRMDAWRAVCTAALAAQEPDA